MEGDADNSTQIFDIWTMNVSSRIIDVKKCEIVVQYSRRFLQPQMFSVKHFQTTAGPFQLSHATL